ncbi:MAG: PEP-CTERM sorting domain-containing protein [Candidatus Margulisbacteria bacterium]|nr:PEP-CTERM sorting domain-containing protein [Candidatus Margulisiibacteriota bacterium]
MRKVLLLIAVLSYAIPVMAAVGGEIGVPEPTTMALIGLGAVGAAFYKKFKK